MNSESPVAHTGGKVVPEGEGLNPVDENVADQTSGQCVPGIEEQEDISTIGWSTLGRTARCP